MLRLGTRASALAIAQAELVKAALSKHLPLVQCDFVTFSTEGDRDAATPLPEIGGKGVFTADLEAALRSGEISAAVHSLKDLPTVPADGLVVAAVLERADPADVVVSRSRQCLDELKESPAIGTSSLRRAAQVLALRADARLVPLRGNVETRIRKARDPRGPYDAIVLAAAGLVRLGLAAEVTERLSPDRFLPAPGQGAVAVQCRADGPLAHDLAALDHAPTRYAVSAERSFLEALGMGCSAPVAAWGRLEHGTLVVDGFVAEPDGGRPRRAQVRGAPADAERLGRELAGKVS